MTFNVGDRVCYLREDLQNYWGPGTVVATFTEDKHKVRVKFDSSYVSRDLDVKSLKNGSELETTFERRVYSEVSKIADLLISKNRKYGDSALNPVRTFSKADSVEQIKVRIDDKLSRIQRGQGDDEDTVTDLIGYLIMLKIAEGKNGS